MNGITIIDTIEIYELSGWQVLLGFAPFIVCFVVMLVRLYRAFKKGTAYEQARAVISTEHWNPKEFIISLVGAVLSFALMLGLETYCPAKYIETQYNIVIDDSVSFNDFHEKYEIVSIDGNEYRVKEK